MASQHGNEANIGFRALAESDLATMKRWLDDPDVSPWYGSDSTDPEALQEEYGDMIRGEDTTRGFMITINGTDAGYIQCYVIDDEPDYARQIQVEPGAVGIDLFIGEPVFRNRGLGSVVIRALLEQVVFGEMDAPIAIIAPEPGNTRAIRSYEKVGFVWQKTVHIVDESPSNTGDEYVMRLTREDYDANR